MTISAASLADLEALDIAADGPAVLAAGADVASTNERQTGARDRRR
jgi:hypothetical protein